MTEQVDDLGSVLEAIREVAPPWCSYRTYTREERGRLSWGIRGPLLGEVVWSVPDRGAVFVSLTTKGELSVSIGSEEMLRYTCKEESDVATLAVFLDGQGLLPDPSSFFLASGECRNAEETLSEQKVEERVEKKEETKETGASVRTWLACSSEYLIDPLPTCLRDGFGTVWTIFDPAAQLYLGVTVGRDPVGRDGKPALTELKDIRRIISDRPPVMEVPRLAPRVWRVEYDQSAVLPRTVNGHPEFVVDGDGDLWQKSPDNRLVYNIVRCPSVKSRLMEIVGKYPPVSELFSE